jgi:hypothetical protein
MCIRKEFRGFRREPVILLLKHGESQQLVYAITGGPLTLGLINVAADVRLNRKAPGYSHSKPAVFLHDKSTHAFVKPQSRGSL